VRNSPYFLPLPILKLNVYYNPKSTFE